MKFSEYFWNTQAIMLSKFFTIPVLSQSVTSRLHILFFILLEKNVKKCGKQRKIQNDYKVWEVSQSMTIMAKWDVIGETFIIVEKQLSHCVKTSTSTTDLQINRTFNLKGNLKVKNTFKKRPVLCKFLSKLCVMGMCEDIFFQTVSF